MFNGASSMTSHCHACQVDIYDISNTDVPYMSREYWQMAYGLLLSAPDWSGQTLICTLII